MYGEQEASIVDTILKDNGFERQSDRLWILQNDGIDTVRVSLSYETTESYNEKDGSKREREWVVTIYERGDLFLTKAVMYSSLKQFDYKFEQYMRKMVVFL